MNKIYLYCYKIGYGLGLAKYSTIGGDVRGVAVAEDGDSLYSHISSDVLFAKYDLGYDSNNNRGVYIEKYPKGYELEWIDEEDLDSHAGLVKALVLMKEREIEDEKVK